MDVLVGLASQAAFLWTRGLKPVWIVALAGLLASCSSSKPPPPISQPPESFAELKQKIALFRGLPFKREVSLAKESSDAPTAPSEGILSDEYGAQSLVHIARTYKRLGLLPESIDFAAALADYTRLERIFYYESRKDLIVISPVATQVLQVMREERGRNLEQLPVVLALSRALQEQHFQWQEKLNRISLEDRKLAFRALTVGDSVLVGTASISTTDYTVGFGPDLGQMGNCLGKNGFPSSSTATAKTGISLSRRKSIYSMGSCGKRMGWSQCGLCRSTIFDLADPSPGEILRQTRRSAGYPRFRLGAANEGKRGRRSDVG